MRAAIIVLGDVGRSPRMQYHALALAVNGAQVDLVGYEGTPAISEVESHPAIRIHRLPQPRTADGSARGASFVALAGWRAAGDAIALARLVAWSLPKPQVVLVQTPPAIPTLLVAWLVARVRGARFAIDWHNFGDRMLALRLGPRHPIVRLAGWYERTLGRRADAHLVVSEAMQQILRAGWRLESVTVVHDRPAARFRVLDDIERASARRELLAHAGVPVESHVAIAISPTSWTADEDFNLLIEALEAYDGRSGMPPLLVVITGDGPRRRAYEERLSRLGLNAVAIRTAWLDTDAYPRLLAAADIGICLHRSASGVDLPMKVADCVGAGVPVCAYDYGPGLRAYVADCGTVFSDAATLAAQLAELLAYDRAQLKSLRAAIAARPRITWEEGWRHEAWPVLGAGAT
jgi:beta-1,4-mannosyltransferase